MAFNLSISAISFHDLHHFHWAIRFLLILNFQISISKNINDLTIDMLQQQQKYDQKKTETVGISSRYTCGYGWETNTR